MFIRSLFGTLSLLFVTFLLSACTMSKPYHTNQTNEEAGTKNSGMAATVTPCFAPQSDPQYRACVRFVEYDDFGNAFNRAQLNETLSAASAVARRDGIIVVYVHGWEHNAQSGDDDVESFYHAMQDAQKIDLMQYKDKREVFGIYIGWRGKSSRIPGVSKLTFWERKTTAQAIGDGAVFELFRRLANERQKSPHSRLVLIGHSFGAAVTYASVFHSITSQIIDDPSNANEVKLTSSDASKRWDMVVLINPAFEAMQLRSHLELARSREYLPSQLPHLMMITTQADWATRIAFPAGRYVRSIFNKYGDDASPELYRTAVGHYLPYVTHQLAAVKDCASSRQVVRVAAVGDKLSGVAEKSAVCFDDVRASLPETAGSRKALPVLLTRCDEPGDCALVAGQHRMVLKKHMPILNIRTTADVMSGHNDIWNPTMKAFLVQMMLSIVHQPDAETATARQVNASSGPHSGK